MKAKTKIIIILSILLCVVSFDLLYIFQFSKMEYECPSAYNFENKVCIYSYSKAEIKDKIEDIVDVHFYGYHEKELKNTNYGYSMVLYRQVFINKNLDQHYYILTLTHELCHVKYNTADERRTQYNTFVKLYNSEFKNTALKMAYDMQHGVYCREYDCLAQIINYLNKNK